MAGLRGGGALICPGLTSDGVSQGLAWEAPPPNPPAFLPRKVEAVTSRLQSTHFEDPVQSRQVAVGKLRPVGPQGPSWDQRERDVFGTLP